MLQIISAVFGIVLLGAGGVAAVVLYNSFREPLNPMLSSEMVVGAVAVCAALLLAGAMLTGWAFKRG